MRGLDDMYLFKMVVDCGGLSPAGRQLGTAKSTLARRLADLETRLGAPLFHRGSRKFVLTSFGQDCYRQCARVASEADRLFAMAEGLRATPGGSLHVIAPPYLSEHMLEPLVVEFVRENPGVRVHLDTGASVLDPRFVAADLIVYPAFEPLPDTDIVARKLFTSPYVLVADPEAVDVSAIAGPADLSDWPCLGFGRKSVEWVWRLRRGRESCLVHFEPRFSTYHLSALRQAVLNGLGIASMPIGMCMGDLEKGRLARVLEDWQPAPVNVFAVYPSSRALSTAARKCLGLLADRLPEMARTFVLGG